MNELSKLKQQALATGADTAALTLYNDRVFHHCRTNVKENTLRMDLDYCIEQEPLYEGGKGIAVRIHIRDIHTHVLVKTIDLPYVQTIAVLHYNRYQVIRKAENDKSILLIRTTHSEDRFYEVDMQAGHAGYVTHILGSPDHPHWMFSRYADWIPDGPVYYRGKLYYIRAANHENREHPGNISLHWYHLKSGKAYTYDAEIFKPDTPEHRAICLAPETGILTAYCYGLGRLTQIDLTRDIVVCRAEVYRHAGHGINVFPADKPGYALLVSRTCRIQYFSVQTGSLIFTIDLDALSDQVFTVRRRQLDWYDYTVHQMLLNREETFAAIVISDRENKSFIIFDVQKQAITMQCNMIDQSAFPLYCRSKMQELGFSQEALKKTESTFLILYCARPFYWHPNCLRHTTQSTGGYSVHCVHSEPIYFFDHRSFRLHVESIDLPFDYTSDIALTEENGIALFTKYQRHGGKHKPATVLCAYHIADRRLTDTLDVTDRSSSSHSMHGDYSCPALQFQGKSRFVRDDKLAVVNRQGKIQIIEDANTIVDISSSYIARMSHDKRKLFVYTRDHTLVTTIVPGIASELYTARFSRKEGFINLFYYNPYCIQRYDIALYAAGNHNPEAVVPITNTDGHPLSGEIKESPDGQYLYQIHRDENRDSWLRVTQIDTADVLSDLPLLKHGIQATEMGIADEQNRFVMLCDDYTMEYVNPFTLDILARLYLYNREKFLIITYSQGKEDKYFYTNAPEMIGVYEKSPAGDIHLLEKGDTRRQQYLYVYNNPKKVHDILYNPERFKQEQQQLQNLLHIAGAGRNLLPEADMEAKLLHPKA